MITFNNELETARDSILNWTYKESLKSVTIVRDVFGKLSFLIDTEIPPDEAQCESLENLLTHDLKEYYTGKTYPKKRNDIWSLFMRC